MVKKAEETIQSKGGKARAEALTPERRSELARVAADARWATRAENGLRVRRSPCATHLGSLRIGDTEIPCAVLDNGLRVLTAGGVALALEYRKKTANIATPSGSPQPPGFLASASVKECISDELMARILAPLEFRMPRSAARAFGYEATLLPQMCEAILEARSRGLLKHNQHRLAEAAEVLVRGLARVGVVALVDEATGYQDERDRQELHKLLEAYISKELLPWTKRFPDEFYREMFRLRGWSYRPVGGRRTMFAGFLTNKLVYDRLPPGVLAELKAKNPVVETGRRRYRHHQLLTTDIGHEHLRDHLLQTIALMRGAPDWDQFEASFNRAFPVKGVQLSLQLPPDADDDS